MTPQEPLNLKLIFATDDDVKGMRPIKVLDIMEGMTKNFHPDGLFSTDIFGKVGGEFRNRIFSYIDLRVPVFHPTLYKTIVRMKALYGEIMAGKSYAVFNSELKDFEKSTIMEGETGFNFFFTHYPKLVLEDRKAQSRKTGVKLLENNKNLSSITRLLVIPAGLRDYVVDDTGKPSEDEINLLYRKVMMLSFSLDNIAVTDNIEFLDATRNNIQNAVINIYEHILNLTKGKKKAIQSHWTTRRIINSTRNVITSHIPAVTELGGFRSVNPNQTIVGLYQFLRAAIPLNVKAIREKFSQKIFTSQSGPAIMTNMKTNKKEQVNLGSEYYDKWMTYEGLEKIFGYYADQELRHQVLQINGYAMGLLFEAANGDFKIIQDIDEIPEGYEGYSVKPITMTEMLYICTYELSKNIMAFVTRYPVAGYGGIYPCYTYLRSTVKALVKYELDDFWQRKEKPAEEFPIRGEPFVDSMSPSPCHLSALNAKRLFKTAMAS